MKLDLAAKCLLAVVLSCSAAPAIPLAYEGFDYPNDSLLVDGMAGGFGWAAPWVSQSSPLQLSQDGVSLESPVFPFPTIGQRTISTAGAQGIAFREIAPAGRIDMSEDGNVLFASFLLRKDGDPNPSTGGNNVEFDLGVNGGTQIRFGSTSGHQFFLNVGSNTAGTVELGVTYMMVLKLTSNATEPDLAQASFFSPTDTLPSTEPADWDLTHNPNLSSTLNTVRAWVGAGATGSIDEIRLGRTWEEVTMFDPTFLQGDFNGNGVLDSGDFQILADNLFTGTSYEEGDFDLNGIVDLRDFVGFRAAYHAASGAAGAEVIPEPTAWALLVIGGLLAGVRGRHRDRRSSKYVATR